MRSSKPITVRGEPFDFAPENPVEPPVARRSWPSTSQAERCLVLVSANRTARGVKGIPTLLRIVFDSSLIRRVGGADFSGPTQSVAQTGKGQPPQSANP